MSESSPADCPFCQMPAERILACNTQAFAVADAFPVSAGHTLIILRRHVPDFFLVTSEELAAIHELLGCMKAQLESGHHPGGYNVGVNIGATAGQTMMHVHVHLIPRYAGDVTDPRGGIRNVLPGKGPYG
jgi:diadenosine tetraphosphate (Ap4A) HIT family hydrolase